MLSVANPKLKKRRDEKNKSFCLKRFTDFGITIIPKKLNSVM